MKDSPGRGGESQSHHLEQIVDLLDVILTEVSEQNEQTWDRFVKEACGGEQELALLHGLVTQAPKSASHATKIYRSVAFLAT